MYRLLIKIFVNRKVSIPDNWISRRTWREMLLTASKARECEDSVDNAQRQKRPNIGNLV
jgi:hypothetical protein